MRASSSRPEDAAYLYLAVATTALEFGVSTADLLRRQRGGPQICFARQMAMYLLYTVYEFNFSRIGQLVGRHYTTISHAVRVVEDSRDDPILNAKIDRLEDFLAQAPRQHSTKMEAA